MKNLKQILSLTQTLPELGKSDFAFFSGKSRTTEFIGEDEEICYIKDEKLWRTSVADGSTKSFSFAGLFGKEIPLIVAVIYNELNEEYHTFHRSGEIYCFRTAESDETVCGQPCEPIEGGISAVEWSPDEECGVVVNDKNEMFILTSSCDVINYWDLQDDLEGEQKFINVGWGKKETQFQGSAGKAAAFSKPEQVSSDEITDFHSVNITWRGDSSLFGVSFWCRNSSKRKIKIFNKDGVLQCNGEDLNGLEEPLCWRPQGNLLTMVQKLPNKYVVAFMEKNGLKHYDFTLPSGLKVVDLKWNVDSQILATVCHNTSSNNYELLFWTSKNYHWYLKQSFIYPAKPIALSWDLRRENRIKIALSDGNIHILEFIWTVDHSGYSAADDKSYAAVIDNKKLLVTSFSEAVVPPPMAMWTLAFDNRVNQVCYPLHKSEFSIAAVCEGGAVLLISRGDDQQLAVTSTLTMNPAREQTGNTFGWVWLGEHEFACLEGSHDRKCCVLIMKGIDSQLGITRRITFDFPVVTMLRTSSGLLLGKSDGSYSALNLSSSDDVEEVIGFPELCLDPVYYEDQLIGLSENGRLYLRSAHVASNITSCLVASPFIIATTSLHTLLVLKFTGDGCEETSRRKLENGSKLVLTTGTSVVLQLPRGNLETIQPRALTFVKIGSLLDTKQYGEAVKSLRRNRILLDVCIDHNPGHFLENAGPFVEQVDPHSLLILVSEMSPHDVTSGNYSSFYGQGKPALEDKVNVVCSALLDEMNRSNRAVDFTLAKLSCLVKMKKMEDAFRLADSDQALQHLLFLVPVEKLYSHALEAYNLPVALKIAGKSQMDPKEYVPYLNQLRAMDADYMKFTIDKSLKKYSSALSHLANCGASKEEECFAFISENCLFKQGLTVFEPNSDNYKKCASMYGEHLYRKRCYEEAGCMYGRAGNAAKAIDAFVASCSWQRALSIAKAHLFSRVEIDQLGRKLQERLMSADLYKEAALLSEHLHDHEGAVEAFSMGNMWEESLLVANLHRPDLIESKIKPSLIDSANNYMIEISAKIESIDKYADRLKVVRIEKANKPKFQEFDDMSETSSVSSRSGTSQGSKSSKMTRKASRKLWSLKEGNPREEEALLSALREIYLSAEKFPGEVKKLCSALVYLELDELAQNLQLHAKDAISRLQKALPSIWLKDPNEEPTAAMDAVIRCAPDIHIPSGWELETLTKSG